jgi:cytochrome c556
MRGSIRNAITAGLLAAVLGVGLVGTASADGAANIKYRQAHMKALGGHMGALAAVIKGQAGSKEHVAGHAKAIAAIGTIMGDLFPADSAKGETTAKPEIWSKPDDFRKAVVAFAAASTKLGAAAGSDLNAVKAAFGGVGKSCGGCHKPFRVKKK